MSNNRFVGDRIPPIVQRVFGDAFGADHHRLHAGKFSTILQRLTITVAVPLLFIIALLIARGASPDVVPPVHAAPSMQPISGPRALSSTFAVPVFFEPNVGQFDGAFVHFGAQTGSGAQFFRKDGIDLMVPVASVEREDEDEAASLSMTFLGSSSPTPRGVDRLPGLVHRFQGPGEGRAFEDIPTYSTIVYGDLYPGIEARFDTLSGVMKGTFIVAPTEGVTGPVGSGLIRWDYEGADDIAIDMATGDLVVTFAGGRGTARESKPIAWQPDGQDRTAIEVGYHVDDEGVGFEVGEHDPTKQLIIDPYSTYFGNSRSDWGQDIEVVDGEAYVVGTSFSNLMWGQPLPDHNQAFVLELDVNGNLVYLHSFDGTGHDGGSDIAVNASGDACYVGQTSGPSVLFPSVTTTAALVICLDSSGNRIGSRIIDGGGSEVGHGIAWRGDELYVVGRTNSTDLAGISASMPEPFSATRSTNDSDMFLARLDASVSNLPPDFLGYYGGAAQDCEFGCRVAAGMGTAVIVTGDTDSSDLALRHALDATLAGGTASWAAETYVARFEFSSTSVPAWSYSTYLGGSSFEEAYGLVLDSSDNAIVVGTTSSADFPTTQFAIQSTISPGGERDGFVTRLDWDGPSHTLGLGYSTFLGGDAMEQVHDVAVDGDDNAYVIGRTNSSDFPGVGVAAQGVEAFIAVISHNGATLINSFLHGGSLNDSGAGIAVGTPCEIYATGRTESYDYPVSQSAEQGLYSGDGDTWVANFDYQCPCSIDPDVDVHVLREGETFDETITKFIPGAACVVDVYLLVDETGSMGSSIAAVKANATQLVDDLSAALPDCSLAYGVGAYRDFPISVADPYAFGEKLPITPDDSAPNRAAILGGISSLATGYGGDGPEGQIYALHEVATRASIGWRSDTSRRLVVWIGDAPGHDPVCASFTGYASDLTQADATNALSAADIGIVALSVGMNNLDGTENNKDYPCPNVAVAGQATSIVKNASQPGSLSSGISAPQIVNTIVNQVTTATISNDVCATANGAVAPLVTISAPAGPLHCYTSVDGTIDQSLAFDVTFSGAPCEDVEQIIFGTLDFTVNGEVVATKTVELRVPPCCLSFPLNGDPLNSGPDHWWPLDETTGTTAVDFGFVGGSDGRHVGTSTATTGQYVLNSRRYAVAGGYTTIPDAPTLRLGSAASPSAAGSFTIELWLRGVLDPTAGADIFKILDKRLVSATDDRLRGYSLISIDGVPHIQLADGSSTGGLCGNDPSVNPCTNYSSTISVADGNWHFVAVTVDRTQDQGYFYIDDLPRVPFSTASRTGSLASLGPLDISLDALGLGEEWPGELDEIELFNRALSADELRQLYEVDTAGKCKPTCPEICGVKFNDANGDGVWQTGTESTIPGWEIEMTFPDGTLVGTATTDDEGRYCLELPSGAGGGGGQVHIGEVLQPGWVQTAPDAPGRYEVRWECFPPAAPWIQICPEGLAPTCITPVDPDEVHFGNRRAEPCPEICGVKFNDANGDGIWQTGTESTLAGWEIQMVLPDGTLVDTATTDADGHYCLELPSAGTGEVFIGEVLQPGWAQTAPGAPGRYQVRWECHPTTAPWIGICPEGLGPVCVTPIDPDEVHFGNRRFEPCPEICGVKFNDTNGDGIWQTGTESTLAGWEIQMVLPDGTLVDTATTDDDGRYCLELPSDAGGGGAGKVYIGEVLQPGWVQTAPGAPGRYEVHWECHPTRAPWIEICLEELAPVCITPIDPDEVHFGNRRFVPEPCPEICGVKFNDTNGDGIWQTGTESTLAGWEIQMSYPDGTLVDTATTDDDGRYCLELPSGGTGQVFIGEVLQPGWVQTAPVAPGRYQVRWECDPTAAPWIGICPEGVGPVCSTPVEPDEVHFGNVERPCAELCGGKWNDKNGDGVKQATEPGLSNVTIELVDSVGTVVATTTTGSGGGYCFGLPKSFSGQAYTIREIKPAGYTQTWPKAPGTYSLTFRCIEGVPPVVVICDDSEPGCVPIDLASVMFANHFDGSVIHLPNTSKH